MNFRVSGLRVSGLWRISFRTLCFALYAILASSILAHAQEKPQDRPPEEPDSYRSENYRSPTPLTLKGVRVVSTDEAHKIWQSGEAAFIDVLPRAPRPANLPKDTLWHEKPRLAIPGSLWLPDTGYGELAPETLAYFKAGLQTASNGNFAKKIVIYCLADCWMSWNAAKRALELGHSEVIWYPDGTDGWRAAGFNVEEIRPMAR